MSSSGPDLIPTSDVARMLGESVRQINRRAERGELETATKLPGLRGGRLFDRSDVERYLEGRDAR